ncbi:hypothetical protein LDK17_05685 [Fusobacterium polymorphum]|jgi:hypothetical protein|uniref:hypothetical protein n=1 Tax=Fusobacterium nucleatum subsp. polymorphum TaxID=76857 RepID=UPI0030CFECCE
MLGNKKRKLIKIDLKKIEYNKKCKILLENLKKKVTNLDSQNSYIVSLTSYGERLKTVWLTIQSIFSQSCKLAKVILWVAYTDKNLINNRLKELEKNGLIIGYCDDILSYKKLIYSVKEYNNFHIITVDDDVIYPKNYFKKLIQLHKKYPNSICCYRAHEICFEKDKILDYKNWRFHSLKIKGPNAKIMAIGIGGILYPAGVFEYKDFDFNIIKNIIPYTDDIYFKWLELNKGIGVVKVYKNKKHLPYYIENTQENSLKMLNIVSGNNNDLAIKKIEKYFNSTFYEKINNMKRK